MTADTLQRSIERAIDLPTGTDQTERASWVLRGFSEAALFAVARSAPMEPLDEAVAAHAELLGHGDPRFASRLRKLRQLSGAPPRCYSDLGREWMRPPPPRPPEPGRVAAFCRLADLIDHNGTRPQGDAVSAADGHGRAALAAREEWRPAGLPTSQVRFTLTAIDASLAWRVWAFEDGAPSIVVVAEILHAPVNDIWWGVHNGTHLDHIGHVAAQGHDACQLEYGQGLLVAESLAMTVEFLAALEAPDRTSARVVWDGLVERLARLPVPAVESPTAAAAREATDVEFAALPTLAAAYTTGTVEILAAEFDHPMIPPPYRLALTQRWEQLANRRPDVDAVLRDLR